MSITLALDRREVRVGQVVLGTITVRNGGGEAQSVGHGFDGAALGEWSVVQGIGPFRSLASSGTAGDFRERAAASRLRVAPDPYRSCPRGRERTVLIPGQSVIGTFRWAATTVNGSLYDGDMVLTATNSYAPAAGGLGGGFLQAAEVALRVTGGDPDRVAPVQALDSALADPGFGGKVDASDRETARASVSIQEPVSFADIGGKDFFVAFTPNSRDGLGDYVTATVSQDDGHVVTTGMGYATS